VEKDNTRFISLDGLRGIAVLLVFLNHLSVPSISFAFPFLTQLGLFSSGISGVSFFFILSGFLMSYLYPLPKSKFGFLQKRYTRIFPLFLTMCTVMFLFTLYPTIPWYFQLSIIFSLALFVHIIWVYGIKKITSPLFSRGIFFLFLLLQFVIGGVYFLWILRQPPIVFQHFPPILKNGIIGLVNATLTFPLGNYVSMLDGVYWSLAAEILFYVLYPFLIVPVVVLLAGKKRIVKILFLLSLLPFIAGFDLLSHYLFNLSTFQFSLFYYFGFGIFLGYLFRKRPQVFSLFSRFSNRVSWFIPLLFFALLFVGEQFISNLAPSYYSTWIRLFSAFPFALVVAFALNRKNSLYKLLSARVFVFLGTISYSIYLSHTAVLHMIENTYQSGSIISDLLFVIITLGITIALSYILYLLLEKPYFKKSDTKKLAQNLRRKAYPMRGKRVLVLTYCIYLICIFIAFQSNYNIFSIIVPNPSSLLSPKVSSPVINLSKNPTVKFIIHATENNLGVISVIVTHYNPFWDNGPQLYFTLQEEGNVSPIIKIPYVLDEFRGVSFPFGIPKIPDSKGKNYIATFTQIPPSQRDYVTITSNSLQTVYEFDKRSILHKPQAVIHLLFIKLQTVLTNQLALFCFWLSAPLLLLLCFLIGFRFQDAAVELM